MADLRKEEIRARITIGAATSSLVYETPNILSFSVSRSRTQPSATFSAQIEVSANDNLSVGTDIVIEAGTRNNIRKIFTGSIKGVTVNPHWDKANVYIVSLDGSDALSELEGKRYSRRQKCLGLAKMAIINGIVSKVQHKDRIRNDRYVDNSPDGGRFLSGNLDLGEVPGLIRTKDINTSNPYSLYAKRPSAVVTKTEVPLTMFPDTITAALATGTSIECTDGDAGTNSNGMKWAVYPSTIGTIIPDEKYHNTRAIFTALKSGYGKVIVTDAKGRTGSVSVSSMQRHDHAQMGTGGPAFGVYKSG